MAPGRLITPKQLHEFRNARMRVVNIYRIIVHRKLFRLVLGCKINYFGRKCFQAHISDPAAVIQPVGGYARRGIMNTGSVK